MLHIPFHHFWRVRHFWREFLHALSSSTYELDDGFHAITGDAGLQEISADVPAVIGGEGASDAVQATATGTSAQAAVHSERSKFKNHRHRWLTTQYMLGKMLKGNLTRKLIFMPTVALAAKFILPEGAMEAIQPFFYGMGVVLGFESLRHIDEMSHRNSAHHAQHSHEHKRRWLRHILKENAKADTKMTLEIGLVLPEILRNAPALPALIIASTYAVLMPLGNWILGSTVFWLEYHGIKVKAEGQKKLKEHHDKPLQRLLHGHTRHHIGEFVTKLMGGTAATFLWLGAFVELIPGGRLMFRASPATQRRAIKFAEAGNKVAERYIPFLKHIEKAAHIPELMHSEAGTILYGMGTCAVTAAFPFAAYKVAQRIVRRSPTAQQKLKAFQAAAAQTLAWSQQQPVVKPALAAQKAAFHAGADIISKITPFKRKVSNYKGLRVYPGQKSSRCSKPLATAVLGS